jgi:hypothetical protein
MNDDTEWLRAVFNNYIYGKTGSIWVDEVVGKDMAYSYNRGYYNDTRGDEVATAVLEAYNKGIDFDTLLEKNKQVRAYWGQIQAEKIRKAQARERARERDRKLAEKRAIEKAQREEVMAKLTQEELEALGLVKKGNK